MHYVHSANLQIFSFRIVIETLSDQSTNLFQHDRTYDRIHLFEYHCNFARQRYCLLCSLRCVKNNVDLVPLACKDDINAVSVKGSDIDMCSAIYFLFDRNTKYCRIYLCPHTVVATVWLLRPWLYVTSSCQSESRTHTKNGQRWQKNLVKGGP